MVKILNTDPGLDEHIERFGILCKTIQANPNDILDYYNEKYGMSDEDGMVLSLISITYFTGMI